MKATIEFEDHLYRRLKVEAARQGRTIREMVEEGVRRVLGFPPPDPGLGADPADPPSWFGVLGSYADGAGGAHDLASMRRSIEAGRTGDGK